MFVDINPRQTNAKKKKTINYGGRGASNDVIPPIKFVRDTVISTAGGTRHAHEAVHDRTCGSCGNLSRNLYISSVSFLDYASLKILLLKKKTIIFFHLNSSLFLLSLSSSSFRSGFYVSSQKRWPP